jgi:hypothetical protein
MQDDKKNIACHKCKHFHVTWDKDFPNGYKAMGFKSRDVPSIVVHQCSGMACLQYEQKNERR